MSSPQETLMASGVEVRRDAPLSQLTTLRVGGPAHLLAVVQQDAHLAAVGEVAVAHGLPWLIIGRGSNLLVPDEGWPGIAIVLGRGYRGIEIGSAPSPERPIQVRAGAAEPLPVLAVKLAEAAASGFAWAAAVPGTLGGAVRMNAGAHGGQMRDHLIEVDLFRLRTGMREIWTVDALGLSYRRSHLPDDAVVVSATLELAKGEPDEVRNEIAEIRAWRRANQPLNEPNCGSVFTNPPGDSAGRLVEAAGCKGMAVGGASISTRHANFIITRAGTRAADVHELIEKVRARVAEHAGVDLRPEVVRATAGSP